MRHQGWAFILGFVGVGCGGAAVAPGADAAADAERVHDATGDGRDGGLAAQDATPDIASCEALDCDDGDECTRDTCVIGDGAADCSHEAFVPDLDADGHGAAACGGDDCDDADPMVHLEAVELCDGLDQNCDGVADEGIGDTDGDGLADCVDPDDDGDGVPDDADDCPLDANADQMDTDGDGLGDACDPDDDGDGTPDGDDCAPRDPTVHPGAMEVCNGIDDDCNRNPDNGFPDSDEDEIADCVDPDDDDDGVADGDDCEPLDPAVSPAAAERCNDRDDDCDGIADDGFDCRLGEAHDCTVCGGAGMRRCLPDCSGLGLCIAPEVCNGCDDDRDGIADNGFPCSFGATRSCTTGCGTDGMQACDASCRWGACLGPEECNGCDDDGDGDCDNGYACCQGVRGIPCITVCGTPGTGVCAPTCGGVLSCAGVEVCNGCDDDGDGSPDNGFACAQGSSRPCMTACGTSGTQACRPACSGFDTCAATEQCNGCDDDGDGSPDNGYECVRGASASCVSACGSTGSRICGAGCVWGSCMPPMEACENGADDDCDGIVDPPCAPGTICLGGRCLRYPPCVLANYGGHAYAFCATRRSWSDARNDCAAYGWYLTAVTSSGENAFLLDRISGEKWMSFNDRAFEGRWVWENGEPVLYTDWCAREPNDEGGEDCGALVQSAGYCGACYCWNDLPCTWTRGYVCEYGS